MTAKVFDEAFKKLIQSEGGYQCMKADRGNWTSGVVGKGELKGTKYGVSAMSYPELDIKNLTVDDCKQIFKKDYWDKCKCDLLPDAISVIVADTAYNSGPIRAVKLLQKALNITDDGVIGCQTVGCSNACNVSETIDRFTTLRRDFIRCSKTAEEFKPGLINRCNDVTAFAKTFL